MRLKYRARANFELTKDRHLYGTVLYYQGRCYEEMGDRAQAESTIPRAKD